MSHSRYHRSQGGPHLGGSRYPFHTNGSTIAANYNFDNYDNFLRNHNSHENSRIFKGNNYQFDAAPSSKRRRSSVTSWEYSGGCYPSNTFIDVPSTCYSDLVPPAPTRLDVNAINSYNPVSHKRDRSKLEVDDVDFMSRDEIEKRSPSRKDGIDAFREAHLRYSYCTFLQNLGLRLDIPQTTVGTSMVLCHRFFVRRSHACHDRFMVATAALFLATKSEETPCPLNNVVKASCEIVNKQDISLISCIFPADWFEQYRERVIEAEQLILTTLNFELNVQHPYDPLTSILEKLGFSQSVLVNMALNLVSEGYSYGRMWFYPIATFITISPLRSYQFVADIAGRILESCHGFVLWRCLCLIRLRSSLWLQFKPHHIAAGAAYLAAKYLNMDLAPSHRIWSEFKTPPFIVEDVARQLMELF